MLEVGGGLDLGEEALGTDYGGQLRLQHFERDLTLMAEVVCEEDGRHAALAEFTLDPVAGFECCVQAFDGVGHGTKMRSIRTPRQRFVYVLVGGRVSGHPRPVECGPGGVRWL